MPLIQFPYGKTSLAYEIPKERYAGTLLSEMHHYIPGKTAVQIVKDALANPIGTPRLCELARGKKKIVIIAAVNTVLIKKSYIKAV